MLRFICAIFLLFLFQACSAPRTEPAKSETVVLESGSKETISAKAEAIGIKVLGLAQDAGYPQIDCKKACCSAYWRGERVKESPTCLGVIDRTAKQMWMMEATPDIVGQWQLLQDECPECEMAGILITHAHMGHYTGLMHLGREAMGAKAIPVYVMPKMMEYLSTNGPWSQLVTLGNIELIPLQADSTQVLNASLSATPFLVPHRDEYSETVGFSIAGPNHKALFIPDIDKWHKWEQSIVLKVQAHDMAFLDGTFYDGQELPGRDISEIPHPFIQESLSTFKTLSVKERARIQFIHFNHTNPLLDKGSEQSQHVLNAGYSIADSDHFYGL